jgi:transglutaminase-like putative cysteine protease
MSTTAPDTHDETARMLALASALVVVASVLTAFYEVTATFGGTPWLVAYVALAFVGASLAARRAPTRVGVFAAAVVLGVGLLGYALLLPPQYYGRFTLAAFGSDLSAWLTGRSVKLMLEPDLWAVGVAPAPVFLTWYLAVRGRYDAAALASGGTLGFLVLTGDLNEPTTLVAMCALLSLLGFGAVATSEGSWRQLQEVGLVVGVILLLTRFVQVVPAKGVGGIPGTGGGSSRSLEDRLLSNRDSMTIGGSPSLSPKPRFRIEADERTYWHTRSFDHYSGNSWQRTERSLGAERPLSPPPSDGTTLQQSVTVQTQVAGMPAAWKPVLLDSDARELGSVTGTGNVEPNGILEPGTTYEVISKVPSWTEGELAVSGTEYRDGLVERYTQLPSSLPDRLVDRTDEITADAEGPYETALAIQQWLTENKRYSLGVEESDWDIADAFVFALDSGYCVYFATAMAVMLRTQGVPSRFVVGYAPGQRVDDNQWLVRGYHSHAWVEVYFADVGWVTFDPTPAAPRQRAQRRSLQGEKETTETPTPTPTPTRTPTPTPTATSGATTNGTGNETSTAGTPTAGDVQPLPGEAAANSTATPTPGPSGLAGAIQAGGDAGTATPTGSGRGRTPPGSRLWLLGALVTLAFGSVRLGYAQSAVKTVWMRYQPRSDDPDADVERALARLEYHLESRFRPREDGETRQQYLDDLDEHGIGGLDSRAWQVLDIYLESQYGDGVDRDAADRAVDVVDDIVR